MHVATRSRLFVPCRPLLTQQSAQPDTPIPPSCSTWRARSRPARRYRSRRRRLAAVVVAAAAVAAASRRVCYSAAGDADPVGDGDALGDAASAGAADALGDALFGMNSTGGVTFA